jgi:hypothetical protein
MFAPVLGDQDIRNTFHVNNKSGEFVRYNLLSISAISWITTSRPTCLLTAGKSAPGDTILMLGAVDLFAKV